MYAGTTNRPDQDREREREREREKQSCLDASSMDTKLFSVCCQNGK